jgi:hypothetical protein
MQWQRLEHECDSLEILEISKMATDTIDVALLSCCEFRLAQKLQTRKAYLLDVGGATELVQRLQLSGSSSWATSDTVQKLVPLVDFLVSHEGLDFHSDEEDPTQKPGALALPTGRFTHVLTHTFRSQLAADILHALAADRRELQSSDKPGVALSVRMANKLVHRDDIQVLLNGEHIKQVAAQSKKRARESTITQDEAVEAEGQVSLQAAHPGPHRSSLMHSINQSWSAVWMCASLSLSEADG